METILVKDLMVPIEEYAVVEQNATLVDAVRALENSQTYVPAGRQPHRAVLVADENGDIVGKLGHLAFLKALEPKYSVLGDLKTLSRVGLSSEFIKSMMDNMQFWNDSIDNICNNAGQIRVKDVMHPATECIDENATIGAALHNIIIFQSLSILVTRGDKIVGILRISDLYTEVARRIKRCTP